TPCEARDDDAFGRRKTVLDERGNTVTTTYDRMGREITSQQTGELNPRRTKYDGFSRVLTLTDKLGTDTTYAYSDTSRTVSITTPELITIVTAHNRHGETLSVTANGNTTN